MADTADADRPVDDPVAEPLVVYSDYVCPFCYLGRASLSQYRETRAAPLDVAWHPFDLRRGTRGPDGAIDHGVDDGKDEAYYERARENVRRLQARYGVEMATTLATDVDSFDAQVASYHVQEAHPDRWSDFDAAIFEAIWVDERDVGDRDVLVDLAGAVGLDGEAVRRVVADPDARERVRDRFDAAYERGVTGVPTFVYGEHVARGAVPPEQLQRLVEG